MPRAHASLLSPVRRGRSGAPAVRALAVVLGGLAVGGCAPKIGDPCSESIDCATDGTRECDTQEPDGYCTVVNCTDDSCPNDAACILFQPAVPGCLYDDYQAPSRIGRAFCMKTCGDDSDCRDTEGYICANPRSSPWFAANLDNNQFERVCIVASFAPAGTDQPDADVCLSGPNMSSADAGADDGGDAGDAAPPVGAAEAGPPGDSGVADAGSEAGADAGLDAGADAGFDAGGHDAGPDAGGAPTDAAGDAAADAGAADASGED